MGNRAWVVLTDGKECGPAVYLHWNGGADSVYAFIAEMENRKIRTGDVQYATARFIQLVGEFFDGDDIGTLSLGVSNLPDGFGPDADKVGWLSEDENGLYIVQWPVIGGVKVRRFFYDKELSRADVAKERKEAKKSADAFAETFAKIDGDRLPK